MFTGLIQATGTVQQVGDYELQVALEAPQAQKLLAQLEIGDSVAVDGVCLTVTHLLATGFIVAVSPETLGRSTLGRLVETGSATVNLEPSLQIGSKLGGHFVTGHVDGLGYLEASVQTATSWEMCFCVEDRRVARYILPKGSIAVNGISLTIADCNAEGTWFKVAVIPLTYAETNLQSLQPGSAVNLEGDILGKYVEKFLRLGSPTDELQAMGDSLQPWEAITPAFLAEHGYE